ncbi:MAG: TauD/TfdA family dioxygenase [Rhodospirillaceae bacterium]|nr:TauD/TfdA family dioxygenase [Rhodospirillaceae bacterium]
MGIKGVIDKNIHYGPFDPEGDSQAYCRWRDGKLENYPNSAHALVVEVKNPAKPDVAEMAALAERIAKTNMVLYASRHESVGDEGTARETVRQLGARFALHRLDANLCADDDAISALSVNAGGQKGRYIPYTNRPISWHTDGYYNNPEQSIRAMILHCASPAASGGDNAFMDPEIAYIMLREHNPDHIRALMHPRAMTIPANDEGDGIIREAQSGPVFSVKDQALHMRYTARTRSVQWRDDQATLAASQFLTDLFESGSPYVFSHRMTAGQGVLCNNVLHRRTGFEEFDQGHRLVLRARYYDRINIRRNPT